jgi:DNA-directed RNA polymerase specialized sigma24 family protein
MGTTNIDASILYSTPIRKAIRGGVISALVGSGWGIKDDVVEDLMADATLKLVDGSLAKFNPDHPNGKGLSGFCRMVAHRLTVNYVQLHVHIHDGAVSRGTVNHTDCTSDGDDTPLHRHLHNGIHADESPLANLRLEQRERLEKALMALTQDERRHALKLLKGGTSAQWAAENGVSTATANRHKAATLAKLTALLASDDDE